MLKSVCSIWKWTLQRWSFRIKTTESFVGLVRSVDHSVSIYTPFKKAQGSSIWTTSNLRQKRSIFVVILYVYLPPWNSRIDTNNQGLENISPSISNLAILDIYVEYLGCRFVPPLDLGSRSCIFFGSLQHFRIFAIWILAMKKNASGSFYRAGCGSNACNK